VSASRHRAAAPPLRARVARFAVPAALATLLTGTAVGVGTAVTGDTLNVSADRAATKISVSAPDAGDLADRTQQPSRTAARVTLAPQPTGRKFATEDLNIWVRPTDKSRNLGTVESGSRVAVTGQVVDGWAEVLLDGKVRYVNAKYLSAEKPDDLAATNGISGAPCADGSGTESGLTSAAVTMFRAVCAAFPALTTYGGWDNHGEHSSGRAIDFMISDPALGDAVAEWLRTHAAELNLYDVIWSQRIYTRERGGEGWRPMSDRGSATANHYDHVHASVY